MSTLTQPNWQTYKISVDETHHTLDKKPAYNKRFKQVLKFHAPGLAPALDETGAYHIDPSGHPIYTERYTRTFGFYCERAAVNLAEDWFHILPNGNPLYPNRYRWCGNFQENLCAVKDHSNRFFHINIAGSRPYRESYAYVGDFHDGAAVAQTDQGVHIHIDKNGQRIHPFEFLDLDVFHKGFARAKDVDGWFHISRSGEPIYPQKYALIEPFYNGVARVETKWGELLLIDEQGNIIQTLRSATKDPFHEVSGDLISYWRLFTLRTAQDFKIFDHLPATTNTLANQLGLPLPSLEKILLALKEMGYVERPKQEWHPSPRGEFLSSFHPFSLSEAQTLWLIEHFDSWHDLTYSLENNKCAFERKYKMGWFEYLEKNPEKRRLYHQALSHYAKRDYAEIGKKIDFSLHQSIVDIGGGVGALLKVLLEEYPHLQGHLLDLPSVLAQIETTSTFREKIVSHPVNFFQKWPQLKVDSAILCRVIHDWSDEKALHILTEAHALLKNASSRLYVVENIMDKDSGKGALLNLNMLVMTGGQERSFDEFISLFAKAGFSCERQIPLNEVSSIMALKPLK